MQWHVVLGCTSWLQAAHLAASGPHRDVLAIPCPGHTGHIVIAILALHQLLDVP